MSWSFTQLRSVMLDVVRNPQDAARQIVSARFPVELAWILIALSSIIAAALLTIIFMAIPWDVVAAQADLDLNADITFNPIGQAITSVLSSIILVAGFTFIGQRFGGTGTFPLMLTLFAVLEFTMVVLQVAMLLAVIVLPLLGMILGILAVAIFFRALVTFVKTGHGFDSTGPAIGTVILSFVFVFFIAMFIPFPTL